MVYRFSSYLFNVSDDMKKLINFDNRDIIAEYEYSKQNTPKNQDGDFEYKNAVKSVVIYDRQYDNEGCLVGVVQRFFTRNEIISMYNSIIEIENEPKIIGNFEDELPF